jgi:integrase
MPHTKVAVYRRDSQGKYHKCVPQGIYPASSTTFVLRYEIERGKRTWEKLAPGTDYKSAVRAALQKELTLDEVPSLAMARLPKVAVVPNGLTPIRAAVDTYIDALWADGNLTSRTIKDKKFELYRWIDRCTKAHIEQIDRADLIAFRDSLRKEGLAEWTVKTNLTSVVTMLKHNPLKHVASVLRREDWPVIEDSEPNPYTVDEVKALQSVATGMERLLIRTFVGTGMRDQEVAHMEWSDIDWASKTVRIQVKPKYGWKPKTKAGTRTVPLPDALVRDLKAIRQSSGLVFSAPRGGVDRHYLRIMERLGKSAGVEGAGLHRFRDSYITDQVQAGVDLLTLRKWVGHQNLETLKLYSEALKAKDQRAREAANRQDKYTLAAHAAD